MQAQKRNDEMNTNIIASTSTWKREWTAVVKKSAAGGCMATQLTGQLQGSQAELRCDPQSLRAVMF